MLQVPYYQVNVHFDVSRRSVGHWTRRLMQGVSSIVSVDAESVISYDKECTHTDNPAYQILDLLLLPCSNRQHPIHATGLPG